MTLTVTLPATVEPKLDRDLVQLCLAGHPDEFRHLVRRYERVVTAHLRLRLGYTDAIDDAAPGDLRRAYLNLAKLRSFRTFATREACRNS